MAPASSTSALGRLAARLDIARRRSGLTYRELEVKTGLARSSLHDLTHGRKTVPDYYLLRGLVSVLGEQWDADGWERLWRSAVERPATTAPEPARSSAAENDPVPRQLPFAAEIFTGRAGALAELDDILTSRPRARLIGVVGPAGVGKTSLVVQWAGTHIRDFPQGQLFADLHGFGPSAEPRTARSVLVAFLRALAVPAQRLTGDVEELSALFRSTVSERRLLVVLDNVRDSDHVLPLLPGSPTCTVIVTSRSQLPTLAARGARMLTVGTMSGEDSLELLTAHVGAAALAAEPDAAAALVRHCAGLPLALAIAATRSATASLSDAAAELALVTTRLDALDGGEARTDMQAVLAWSYRSLPPSAARLMRLLGSAALPELGLEAICALGGLDRATATRTARTLVRRHLLIERRAGRFDMHELVRLAASRWADEDEPAGSVTEAVSRLLHWLVTTAAAADGLLVPKHWRTVNAVGPTRFADRTAALRWLEDEREVLDSAARLANTPEQLAAAGQLPRVRWAYYRQGTDWPGFHDAMHTALDAARRLDDPEAEAVARNGLGLARARLGDHEGALDSYERSLAAFRSLDHGRGEIYVLVNYGDLLRRLGACEKAVELLAPAVSIAAALDEPFGECGIQCNLGMAYGALGQDAKAMTALERALRLARQVDDPDTAAEVLNAMGSQHQRAGRPTEASERFAQAVEAARAGGPSKSLATALTSLAEIAQAGADPALARARSREAQQVVDQLARSDDARQLVDRLATIAATSEAGSAR